MYEYFFLIFWYAPYLLEIGKVVSTHIHLCELYYKYYQQLRLKCNLNINYSHN